LLQTTRQLVEQAATGSTAAELRGRLHVEVKQSLLELVRQKQLCRERIGHHFVYFSRVKERRTEQKQERQEYEAGRQMRSAAMRTESCQQLEAATFLFYSLLDEKQRRLYAGLESLKVGRGGDRRIAELLGLEVNTVGRGRRQLLSGDVRREGVRKKGAGRKATRRKSRK
jgi:hypothetical protein